jgi:hypothetical protein
MPETIEKALNMTIIATNVEKEEKVSTQEDRGTNAIVFTMAGSRGVMLGKRRDKPRGKFQWSGNSWSLRPDWSCVTP